MTAPTHITAPLSARATTSVFLGIAVGIMGAPLANGVKMIVLILAVAIGLLATFSHPYRRLVRSAVESTGARYSTSAAQVMPLFPLWIALMSLPMVAGSWPLALGALIIAATYTWFIHPHIDGTAHLKKMRGVDQN